MKNKGDIIIDSESKRVFGDPQEKLSNLKEKLLPTLEELKKRIYFNERRDKPLRISYNTTVSNKLNILMRREKLVEFHLASRISASELLEFINAFYDLIDFIVDYIYDFVPTKAQFCGFLGTTTVVYNNLLNSPDPEILASITSLEEAIGDISFTSSQSGTYKETSTMNRLKAKGIGHDIDMKSDSEKMPTMTINMYADPNETRKRLDNLFGKKFLNDSKKK